MDEDPENFLKNVDADDLKTFLKWILDCYPKVHTGNSLGNYWRVLKMLLRDKGNRRLDDDMRRDVLNVRAYTSVSYGV